MKLRSIVSVGVMALAAAAFADYTDGKVCGWMRIDSTLPITAVGVPWVDVGNTNSNVKVADLVKTDGLTAGDNLYVYNNGNWSYYTLSGGAWVAGTTANSSITATAGDPNTATIARGQALYLERSVYNQPFYVYGAVGSAIASQTLSGAAGTKFLIASPKAQAFTPTTSKVSGATPKTRSAAGDQIVVPLEGGATRTYSYASGKWGYATSTGRVTQDSENYLPVPLGTGFWYVKAGSGDVTITW